MFSRTSLASWDFFTITSLSFTAVCILRTLDWFLEVTAQVGTGTGTAGFWPHAGAKGPQGRPASCLRGVRGWAAARALPDTATGRSEPALAAMSSRAMHGAHGQQHTTAARGRAMWERGGADVRLSPRVPKPRRAGSCRQHNGADGEQAARARRGVQSLRRGWQPRPPHAARVSRLAPRRQQLSQRTEPRSRTGQPRWLRAHCPGSSGPVPPARGPSTQQTQTYRFSHSLPGAPRGQGERERKKR